MCNEKMLFIEIMPAVATNLSIQVHQISKSQYLHNQIVYFTKKGEKYAGL